MIIIGITGTLGAGKGTIVEYLIQNKGFLHFSAREFIAKEVERRNLPLNRDTLTDVANDLRTQNSPAYIIEMLYKEAASTKKNSVIESIRTIGEIESLRKKSNFVLLAVDANNKLRYQRIAKRKSATDNVTFETFLANEKREMTSVNPNNQNLLKCIELADYILNNDGNIDDLHVEIEKILKNII
jgi:dephospho-CoA kinase